MLKIVNKINISLKRWIISKEGNCSYEINIK